MGSGIATRGGTHGGMRASFAHGGQSGSHTHPPRRGRFSEQRRGFHRRGFGRSAAYRSYAGYYSPASNWYGGPLWDWENSSYDSRDSEYQRYISQTSAEINRLADEVQRLQEEREYVQPAPPPAPAAQPTTPAAVQQDLPVVVVFLDKHIREVKNYVVANEMLVVLDGTRRTKFPLADIDLAATMKLNDERGVSFDVPNPVISQ